MAADIRITPASSLMQFISSSNYNQYLTQHADGSINLYGVGSSGRTEIFSIDGSNGRLFTVTDDLSDSLFSVNTIAGLPVFEVFSDNTIKFGQYGNETMTFKNNNVGIGLSTPMYKLDINGNMNINNYLYQGVDFNGLFTNFADNVDAVNLGRYYQQWINITASGSSTNTQLDIMSYRTELTVTNSSTDLQYYDEIKAIKIGGIGVNGNISVNEISAYQLVGFVITDSHINNMYGINIGDTNVYGTGTIDMYYGLYLGIQNGSVGEKVGVWQEDVDAYNLFKGYTQFINSISVTHHIELQDTSDSKLYIPYGASNGYFLMSDASGYASWSPISNSQVYKGTWNATTNSPTLHNLSGGLLPSGTLTGYYYRVTASGSTNFGAGSITFSIGDDVMYDGSIWSRIPGSTYTLQTASSSVLGGVKIGTNINIDGNGAISVNATTGGTSSTVVLRDSSGNFSTNNINASTVTAVYLNGNLQNKGLNLTAETGTNIFGNGIYSYNSKNKSLGAAYGGGNTLTSNWSVVGFGGGIAGMVEIAGNWSASIGNVDLWWRGLEEVGGSGWFYWKKIWHSGNMGSCSGLNSDLWDGVQKPLNFGNSMYGGSYYESGVNLNTVLGIGESRFVQSNKSNGPTNSLSAGYVWNTAGGDTNYRGVQFFQEWGGGGTFVREMSTATGDTSGLWKQFVFQEDDIYLKKNIPIYTVTSTSYTLILSDNGKKINTQAINGSGTTITVPLNVFNQGAQIVFNQISGQITFSGDSGVTIHSADSKLKTRVQYSVAELIHEGGNVWCLFGDLTN